LQNRRPGPRAFCKGAARRKDRLTPLSERSVREDSHRRRRVGPLEVRCSARRERALREKRAGRKCTGHQDEGGESRRASLLLRPRARGALLHRATEAWLESAGGRGVLRAEPESDRARG